LWFINLVYERQSAILVSKTNLSGLNSRGFVFFFWSHHSPLKVPEQLCSDLQGLRERERENTNDYAGVSCCIAFSFLFSFFFFGYNWA
jgi:hypothetical protein